MVPRLIHLSGTPVAVVEQLPEPLNKRETEFGKGHGKRQGAGDSALRRDEIATQAKERHGRHNRHPLTPSLGPGGRLLESVRAILHADLHRALVSAVIFRHAEDPVGGSRQNGVVRAKILRSRQGPLVEFSREHGLRHLV